MSKKKKVRRAKPGSGRAGTYQRYTEFVETYLVNGQNGTQAAIDVGYSPNSAHVIASKLLNHPKVKGLLDTRRAEIAAKYRLTTDDALRSMAQAMHFDPRKLYDAKGKKKPVHELDDDTAMALASLEDTERDRLGVVTRSQKVKWYDKNTARDQLMKHLGLYERDNEQGAEAAARLVTLYLPQNTREASK